MVSETERRQILTLMKREIVPAIGCTEPMAVALCVAKAAETLGEVPGRIEASLSANILKNAMGVGIPGTGMTGLPIATALGALVGRSEYGLEVLKDVDQAAVQRGKQYIGEGRIKIALENSSKEKLYIKIRALSGEHEATAVRQVISQETSATVREKPLSRSFFSRARRDMGCLVSRSTAVSSGDFGGFFLLFCFAGIRARSPHPQLSG